MTFYAPISLTGGTRAKLKLDTFAALPAGWHYGRGNPISQAVLDRADKVVGYLVMSGISRTDAFPGVDGEVQITGYNGDHFIAVDVNADETFDVKHDVGGVECCFEDDCVWPGVKDVINKVAAEIWGTSDLFIRGTGTRREASSLTSPSRSPQTADFRLLRSSALSPQAA